MTAAAFRDLLSRLQWSQRGLATTLALPHNTVHRWALGLATIPPGIVVWLEAMAAHMDAAPPPPNTATRESATR